MSYNGVIQTTWSFYNYYYLNPLFLIVYLSLPLSLSLNFELSKDRFDEKFNPNVIKYNWRLIWAKERSCTKAYLFFEIDNQ